MHIKVTNFVVLVLASLTIFSGRILTAQPNIIGKNFSNQFQIGGHNPELGPRSAENADISTLSFYTFARYVLSRNTVLEVEIPFSFWELKTAYYTEREFTWGNPYVGGEMLFENFSLSARFGLYVPLAPGEGDKNYRAADMGYMSNYIHGAEFFAADRIPLYGGVRYYKSFSDFFLTLDGGASVWFGRQESGKMNSFFLYQAQLGYVLDNWIFAALLDGRYIFHETEMYFDEKIYNQIGLEVKLDLNPYQPSLFAVKPLAYSYLDSINSFVGLRLTMFLK